MHHFFLYLVVLEHGAIRKYVEAMEYQYSVSMILYQHMHNVVVFLRVLLILPSMTQGVVVIVYVVGFTTTYAISAYHH
jgi:hypothetical protein